MAICAVALPQSELKTKAVVPKNTWRAACICIDRPKRRQQQQFRRSEIVMSCAAPAIQSSFRKPCSSAATENAAVSFQERDAIIMKHLPLVRAIACRVRQSLPVQIDLDDLVHAGILGLFDAVQKYEPSKRVVFHLYAKYRIRGAILDS